MSKNVHYHSEVQVLYVWILETLTARNDFNAVFIQVFKNKCCMNHAIFGLVPKPSEQKV